MNYSRMEAMYEEVLIPTDGSRNASVAANHGLSLAKQYGATVHILHVADTTAVKMTDSPDTIPETWMAGGDRATQQIADRATEFDLPVITEVRRGSPADVILDYVDERGIDLIALGTHGQTGLKKPLLGRVTKNIVNTASVPILCVPPPERDVETIKASEITYQAILVPTDGSKAARNAVDRGLELADTYDATLHALYVVDRRVYASRPGRTWEDAKTTLEQSGEQVMDRIADAAAESDVPIVTDIRPGVPHQVIHDYAGEHNIDLVTMGTHARSGLSKRVLGSVTERVLRRSEIPVLTVRTR